MHDSGSMVTAAVHGYVHNTRLKVRYRKSNHITITNNSCHIEWWTGLAIQWLKVGIPLIWSVVTECHQWQSLLFSSPITVCYCAHSVW